MELPVRKRLYHNLPSWVKSGASYFITINASQRSTNTLACDDVANAIKESISNYKSHGRWYPKLVVVMPDHLHFIIALDTDRFSITSTFTAWKRFIARGEKVSWQNGFFEHRLRNEASMEEKYSYILRNPVRGGLVDCPSQWPYLWHEEDF
ncbi:MAG: REP-associated tyrosine transposase [Opitutales bacterium]